MRLPLLDFQQEYLGTFLAQLGNAAREAAAANQSVSLSAPTGSGKTVIATAAIETLFYGDDDHGPDPEAVVLWITDQPELNRQTRSRMQAYSDRLPVDHLIEIDEGTFDQAELDPGHVYFLNTQKLGANSKLVRGGDTQEYTLWQTFTATLSVRPSHFYVFIDEAHRGMTEGKNRQEATTIIQKFIKGSPGEITAVPLIVGISATLERFDGLLEGTSRVRRPVDIPAEVVRESGLIKDRIVLHHPPKGSDPELTLLGLAAGQLKDYQQQWDTYTTAEGLEPVSPLLVVQVEDGTAKKASSTDLVAALAKCESILGTLTDEQVAHAFDTHTPVSVGSRSLRYVAPSEIEADKSLQVVFFKRSLSVGWDCPRAESLMSFRPAKDATLIAQLVGRMVRTPFARRVGVNEHLNTVAVCLPRYDQKNVDKIIAYLTDPETGALEKDGVTQASEQATLTRADDSDAWFAALEELPSYAVPRVKAARQTERLRQLAQRLSNDGINEDAPDEAIAAMVDVIGKQLSAKSGTKEFRDLIAQAGNVSVEAYTWTFGEASGVPGEATVVPLDPTDLQQVFDAVGRRIGDVYKPWWRHRVETDKIDPDTARRELIALATDPAIQSNIEEAASDQVEAWFTRYKKPISAQNDEAQQEYDRIRGTADKVTIVPLRYPVSIDVTEDDSGEPALKGHAYVDEARLFPGKLNKWERRVIAAEQQRPDFVGWMRNEPNKRERSLCVSYTQGGETKAMYPDFLVLRRDDDGDIVVDLLDPHLTALTDAAVKAVGIASFARDHGAAFGRIELIVLDKKADRLMCLDLQKSAVRSEVLKVTSPEYLEALYRLASEIR